MARQGRLCRIGSTRTLGLLAFLFCCAASNLFHHHTVAAEVASSPPLDLYLEIDWSATARNPASPGKTTDTRKQWLVEVELVDSSTDRLTDSASIGSLSELENRCPQASSCGAFTLNSEQTAWSFRPRIALGDGGARFRVQASRDAHLLVRIQAGTANSNDNVTRIALADLIARPFGPTPPSGHESEFNWNLKRSPEDTLRLSLANDTIITAPNAPLTMRVRANSLVVSNKEPLQLVSSMIRLRDGEVVWSHASSLPLDSFGNTSPLEINDSASPQPGVYELRFEVMTENRLWSRLRRRDEQITRIARPIVILPEERSFGSTIDFSNWTTIQTIKLNEVSDWTISNWSVSNWPVSNWPVTQMFTSRAQSLFPTPQAATKLLRTSDATRLPEETYAGEKVAVIPEGQSFETRLSKLRVGYPHLITLRYPADRPLKVRVQVTSDAIASDSAASDSGNSDARMHPGDADYVIQDYARAADRHRDEKDQWLSQSFLYYAKGNDHLRITNLDRINVAKIESIQLKSGPAELSAASHTAVGKGSRMTAIRVDDFDWVDAFATTHKPNPKTSEFSAESIALDRLINAAMHLSEYAALIGADTLLIGANDGGRTWFKTSQFSPARSEHRFEQQQLEVLLSMIDRCGCQVVIGIDPVMTIDTVETMIAAQLVTSENSGRVRYTLADPILSESLITMTREITEVAKEHSCFSGVALSCGRTRHSEPIELVRLSDGEQDWARQQSRIFYEKIASQCQGKTLLLIDLPDSAFADPFNRGLIDKAWPSELSDSSIVAVATQIRGAYECLSAEMDAKKRAVQKVADWQRVRGQIGLAVRSNLDSGLIDRDFACELNQWVDRLDPQVVLLDDATIRTSLHDGLLETMSCIRALPSQRMNDYSSADPATQTVQLKWGMDQQHLMLLVTNHSPWPSDVDLRCRKAVQWESIGNRIKSIDQIDEGRTTRLRLRAGEMQLLRSTSSETAQCLGVWSSSVSGSSDRIEKIKSDVATVVEKLGTLSDSEPYLGLSNGSFEVGGEVGISGWLHAQYPSGSVSIDNRESIDGKRSLCMVTDGTTAQQTWLVSETITPPKSGRLAVSMSCRAEASQISSSHQVRVSIEGTQSGVSFRYSETVAIPRNGQWQPRKILAEAAPFEPDEVETLRVTIDSLSPGKIWIDDVRLHDFFPTNQERAELQTQSFLAVQGIQRGNLEPSSILLKNRWAQRLVESCPDSRAAQPKRREEPKIEETPGVARRFRDWLPSPIRF